MMETSSPLAAMQHAHNLHYSYQMEGPAAFVARLHATSTFGPDSFNFRDLAMKKRSANCDYFNMPKPVRGSSPTASLAADLSQNMHIDQSPDVPPTPRRALFANNFFQVRDKAFATTPPVASSPGIVDGMDMDMSPLPHKAPFGCVEVQLQSPTPDETSLDSSLLSPSVSDPSSSDFLSPPVVADNKKKPTPRRPSLSRTKGLSTGCIPQTSHPESKLPPFTFGNYQSSKSVITLEQIWESSPPQKPSSPITSVPRQRQPFLATRNAGSPLAAHGRKTSTSNPLIRPRKLTRRSLSMYECPDDVMNQRDNEPALPPIVDLDAQQHTHQLPHFLTDQAGDLPRISKETMIDVLDGHYDHMYEKRVIIDCRFEYEYQGGHIDGAVNFNDKEKLASQLLDVEPTSNALLIFHCEYSAHRAPLTAKFVRNRDRTVNADRYPALTYPEVYILDGGYSSFFKDHRARCYPQNYVEMDAKEHELACEREMGKVKQRSKLLRAQTFAFGSRSPGIDSSPTAMGRSRLDSDDMDMGLDFTPAPAGRPTMDALRRGNLRQSSY